MLNLRERYDRAYWPTRLFMNFMMLVPLNVIGVFHWFRGDDSAAISAALTMNVLSHGLILDLARFVPGLSPVAEKVSRQARPLAITLLSGALLERALDRPLDEETHFLVAFACLWLAGYGRLLLFPVACAMNLKFAALGTLVLGHAPAKNVWFMAICALYLADLAVPRSTIAWALTTWVETSEPYPLVAPMVMMGCSITVMGVMLRDSFQ